MKAASRENIQLGLKTILAIVICCSLLLISGCLLLEKKQNNDNEKSALEITASPIRGIMPLNVSFSIHTKKDTVDIESYFWDFGDDTFSMIENPFHVFPVPGDYIVELTITFTNSTSLSDTVIISVYDKSQFYGTWHYSEGKSDFETITFNPNETINIITQKQGISCAGTYKINNETLQVTIDQLHEYVSYFFEMDDSNKLLLINKKNRESALYIKQGNRSHILYVGGTEEGNYSTIQEAIDKAYYGDRIHVYEGLYTENLVITKSISLRGSKEKKTIIDGGMNGHVIEIYSKAVNLSNLYIRNSSSSSPSAGIKIDSCSQVHIDTCELTENFFGLWLYKAIRNTIRNCTIENNKGDGIMVNEVSSENEISQCIITHNDREGIKLCCGSNFNRIMFCTIMENKGIGVSIQARGNIVVYNNFMYNNVSAYGHGVNVWDDGHEGNYWSDFDEPREGAYDQNKDNVIDSPYIHIGENNQDTYPLSKPRL
jgi:parallel beta-helix repeat protein